MMAHRILFVPFVVIGLGWDASATAVADSPNVILVMFDDLGYGDVGYQGSEHALTPHIDAMADSSLVFTRFYAGAPVCSPTRGSCLTGRHPYRYGVFGANVGHLPEHEPNLATLLRQRGYRTGHFGKWHLGSLTTRLRDSNRGRPGDTEHFAPPWQRGFDVCFATEAKVPTYNPMVCPRNFDRHPGNLKHWWDPRIEPDNITHYGTRYWNERGEPVTDDLEGPDARLVMDRALRFIEDAVRRDRPFLAVIWFHETHWPVVAGPDDRRPFAQLEPFWQHYYGCIRAADEQVGRLRWTLRHLGIAGNTMVWLASDNGPEGAHEQDERPRHNYPGSASPLRGRKRDLYEGGIRVPGLLEWPDRIPKNRVTEMPAVTSDYLPTLADVLEIGLPDDRPLDGISLLPLIEGRMTQRPRPIAFQFRGRIALIDNRFKLIHVGAGDVFAQPPWQWQLYDLPADPAESRDSAADHPDVVERMATELMGWNDSVRSCLERPQPSLTADPEP